MKILYISHLSKNIAAGMNWSIPASVDAQSKVDDVMIYMKICDLIHNIPSCLLSKVHTFMVKRYNGVCIATGTRIYYMSKIINRGSVLIGKNCMIGRKKEGCYVASPFYITLLKSRIWRL